jgi:glycosyltransferase involved in cell wall biosynthesis
MNAQPLISVLMTSYNREKYIAFAIESVLVSTYQNFELIITDDGSKDSTVSIAEKYAALDKRVKVFRNEKNLGDYPNRNRAASHASGKYLKYVDADDYIYPWGLELLVTMMEANPQAGWGLCSLIQVVKEPYPVLLQPQAAYRQAYFGTGLFHKAPLSSIIKKEIFDEAGGFSDLRMVGDFEMWHRLALKYPVLMMPDGIVWYREHGEQEIKDKNQFILKYEQLAVEYLKHKDCPLNSNEVADIIQNRKRKSLKALLIHLLKLQKTEAVIDWKVLKYYWSLK